MVHVGIGYDVHALVAGRKLILGGVEIPHTKGLDGHSDADALMHAICDAVLGALGESDIGHFFPNTDTRWKGAPSKVFLQEAAAQVSKRGGKIINVDATLIAQAPKIMPHIAAMKKANIAMALGVPWRKNWRQSDHERETWICGPRRRYRCYGRGRSGFTRINLCPRLKSVGNALQTMAPSCKSMYSAWGAIGNFFIGKKRFDTWQPVKTPPLEDWMELLDAMQRLITRRRYQPDDEVRLREQILEHYPEAEL